MTTEYAWEGKGLDEDAARELHLYIENDADLYRQQYQPILKNLATKKARGVYDHTKAVKLFGYLVENGAKKYDREMGAGGSEWNQVFPKKLRDAVAEELTDHFEVEHDLGNYSNFLPKKYQPKFTVSHKAKKPSRRTGSTVLGRMR